MVVLVLVFGSWQYTHIYIHIHIYTNTNPYITTNFSYYPGWVPNDVAQSSLGLPGDLCEGQGTGLVV